MSWCDMESFWRLLKKNELKLRWEFEFSAHFVSPSDFLGFTLWIFCISCSEKPSKDILCCNLIGKTHRRSAITTKLNRRRAVLLLCNSLRSSSGRFEASLSRTGWTLCNETITKTLNFNQPAAKFFWLEIVFTVNQVINKFRLCRVATWAR